MPRHRSSDSTRRLVSAGAADVEASLASYVDPRVVRHILSGGRSPLASGVRRVATCLFADIRGFTRFVAREDPRRVVAVLDRYFAWACAIAIAHGGTIDKLIGDGVMVLFGGPLERTTARRRALAAAVAMLEGADAALALPRGRRGPRLGLGVGLATGPVVLANVGSTSRMDYTAVGAAVNLAARLCAEAQHHELLCDAATWHAAEGRRLGVTARARSLRVKGVARPVAVRSIDVAARERDAVVPEDVDPVCGMKVAAYSPYWIRHDARTIRFCSRGCRLRYAPRADARSSARR